MSNENIERLLNLGIQKVDFLATQYHYPSNITHLLYLIIPAFLIKYGPNQEQEILRSFEEIPILIHDQQSQVYQAFYTSVPFVSQGKVQTRKGVVLQNYQNISLMQLLDNLVHEFNHAINSIHQEIRVVDQQIYIRTGLTFIIYNRDDLKPIGKKDNSILEEIINTRQTEMIIDIINSFNQYALSNRDIVNTLYAIQNSIQTNYQSKAYLLQSVVCRKLMENKTFFSTLENLRLIGNIDDIEPWFDSITGVHHSYTQFVELLKKTLELQLEISKKQGIRFFKVKKLKKLNQEAMNIVELFDKNCNYR